MKELSKIWDTVNVKFLSTVRPLLRAPLRKKLKILRGESFTEISSQNLARTKTHQHKYRTNNTKPDSKDTHTHTNTNKQTRDASI